MEELSESQLKSFTMLDGANVKVVHGGRQAVYQLTRVVDPGKLETMTTSYIAELKVDEDTTMPKRLVLKVPCFDDVHTPATAQHRVRTVAERFQREQEQMSRLEGVSSIPETFPGKVTLIYSGGQESPEIDPLLIRIYAEGITLAAWMQSHPINCGESAFRGLRKVEDWFLMARRLVQRLELIHHERVVHGDLRPENIIVRSKNGEIPDIDQIWFINAEEDDVVESKLNDIPIEGVFRRKYDSPFKLFVKSTSAGKAKIRNARADWYAPADVFSLGAILLELACGSDQFIEPFLCEQAVGDDGTWHQILGYEQQQSDRQLKKFVLKALKKSHARSPFSTGDSGILQVAEIIMACCRTQPETQASDLRSVLIIIDQFDPHPPPPLDPKANVALSCLANEISDFPAPISAVMHRRIQLLERDLHDLRRHNLLRISGSRAHHIDVLVTVARSLGEGDVCRGLTTPTFFFAPNMGPYGRVISALHLASLRGALIDWILVVDERGLRDRRVAEVLEAQQQGLDELPPRENFRMQFVVVPPSEYQEVLQKKLTFIEAGPTGAISKRILIAPDYRGEGGTISVLRFWSGPPKARRRELEVKFNQLKDRARPVSRFTR